MKKDMLNKPLLIAFIMLGIGCRPKKVIIATPEVNKEIVLVRADEKPQNLALLKEKDLPFKTLALKGKANLRVNGEENNVTINIRMEKDKKIWVSVTGLAGIEGIRAVITPDSLLLRNNLQKTFTKKPFSYVYDFTSRQVSFKMLQAVLSGNTIAELMTEKSDLKQENGVWVLSGNAEDLAYRILFNTLLKSNETNLNDAKNAQALKVVYGNYTPVNNSLFPSSLKINSMAGVKNINIAIEFIKIERNVAVDFPFSVPKNYQLIN
jgi:hypothetical protein